MKGLFFALLMLGMLSVSCKSSSGCAKNDKCMKQLELRPMGLWKAMEWTSDRKIEKKGADLFVYLPSDKCSTELKCSNYNSFWLSSVAEKNINTSANLGYEGEFYSISCKGNVLKVIADANTSDKRSFDVVVQAGDIFCRIIFVQKKN